MQPFGYESIASLIASFPMVATDAREDRSKFVQNLVEGGPCIGEIELPKFPDASVKFAASSFGIRDAAKGILENTPDSRDKRYFDTAATS